MGLKTGKLNSIMLNKGDFKLKCERALELQEVKPASVGGVWYPNLQELYDLCKSLPKLKDTDDYTLLSKMRMGIAQACCDSYLKRQSMHDFWLMFWMFEKMKKCWHGGAMKWVGTKKNDQ